MATLQKLRIKVCGMRDASNIKELIVLQPDYIGFIFYRQSSRYIGENFDQKISAMVPENIKKVGVFVNEIQENVLNMVRQYNLNFVQLHGNENVEYCRQLVNNKVRVIKSFSISDQTDLIKTSGYMDCCDFFLFDTKVIGYGGSGQKFNWSILNEYKGNKPFFLSGGIDENDVEKIKNINHPFIYAVDINSRFESSPALKDIFKINNFIRNLNNELIL
jgi:phosphoribosylanthranilate isomerase